MPDYLSKAVNVTAASPGDTLYYTVTVSYPGSELLSNVQVNDDVPTGTTYVPNSDWPTATVTPADDLTASLITWNLGSNTAGPSESSETVLQTGDLEKTWRDDFGASSS